MLPRRYMPQTVWRAMDYGECCFELTLACTRDQTDVGVSRSVDCDCDGKRWRAAASSARCALTSLARPCFSV
jgi:hypothetical protein